MSELDAAINMTIVRKGNRLLRWMGNMVSCVFDWINWLMVLLPRSWRGSVVLRNRLQDRKLVTGRAQFQFLIDSRSMFRVIICGD